jgi:hypothetical protein
MTPEIPVDFPEYDYSTWMIFGGETAGTFPIESPFGNNPCEVAILSVSTDLASTCKIEEGAKQSAQVNNRGNGVRMFYCEFGGAGTITPPVIWVPTGGRLTMTTDGVHEYACLVFRRKSHLRHDNPPLDATHHYTPEHVHIAREETVNARKC